MSERQAMHELLSTSFGEYLQQLFVDHADYIEKSEHITWHQLRLGAVDGEKSTEAIIDTIPGSTLLPSVDIVTTEGTRQVRDRFRYGRNGYTYELLKGQTTVEAEHKELSRPASGHDVNKALDQLEVLFPIRPPEITDTKQRRVHLLSFMGNIMRRRR